MAAFARIENNDGSTAVFELSDTAFMQNHGGDNIEDAPNLDKLEPIATAVASIGQRMRSTLTPDSLAVEVGIGLSAEVGWFVAKSQVEASVKITLTWES